MPVLVSTWDFLEAHAEGWRVLAAGDDKKYKYLINEINIAKGTTDPGVDCFDQ